MRWKLKDVNNKAGINGFKVFINESLANANKEIQGCSIIQKNFT